MIELDGYTPKRRYHLKRVGAYCLFAIGRGDGLLKIGIAQDIVYCLRLLNRVTPERPLGASFLVWTPGKPVAARMEKLVHGLLSKAGRRERGEWFKVSTEEAARVIRWVKSEYYAKAAVIEHEQMLEHLAKLPLDKPPTARLHVV